MRVPQYRGRDSGGAKALAVTSGIAGRIGFRPATAIDTTPSTTSAVAATKPILRCRPDTRRTSRHQPLPTVAIGPGPASGDDPRPKGDASEDVELRLLRVPELNTAALWLHGSEQDSFLPLSQGTEEIIDTEEFSELLHTTVRQRTIDADDDGSGG